VNVVVTIGIRVKLRTIRFIVESYIDVRKGVIGGRGQIVIKNSPTVPDHSNFVVKIHVSFEKFVIIAGGSIVATNNTTAEIISTMNVSMTEIHNTPAISWVPSIPINCSIICVVTESAAIGPGCRGIQ